MKVVLTPQPPATQGGGSAFVAKWPYVTAFFCSVHVKGTGSLGGLSLVCRSFKPSVNLACAWGTMAGIPLTADQTLVLTVAAYVLSYCVRRQACFAAASPGRCCPSRLGGPSTIISRLIRRKRQVSYCLVCCWQGY